MKVKNIFFFIYPAYYITKTPRLTGLNHTAIPAD
jgi:hypothetical protein